MTTQPPGRPSSGRPTGPPTGPPAGPLRPGSPPPSAPPPATPPAPPPPPPRTPPQGPGGPGSGGQPTPPGAAGQPPGPWWRSVPRIATALLALAAAVTLAVVLTRPSGTSGTRGEVFLQPAAAEGQDPFTASSAARPPEPEPAASGPAPPPSAGAITTQAVTGSSPTLYGGTANTADCDTEKQVRFLSAQPDRNRAFAEVLGIRPAEVPGYLRSLTSVTLRQDTRVTNHGYRDGGPTAYQAVLQAGTAVMVDDHGMPRVRCACGNPLGGPKALKAGSVRRGEPWAAYRPQNIAVIEPTARALTTITIYDGSSGSWYARGFGGHAEPDRPVPPPAKPPADTGRDTGTAPGTPTGPATGTAPGTGSSSGSAGPPTGAREQGSSPPATPPSSPPPSSPPASAG